LVVGFISKRRIALWVAGMERWAQKEVSEHTEDMPKDRDQRQGLTDASNLLRNVLTSGRVPGRDYAELLSHPDSARSQ
jgi:hypothetical protein